VIDMISSTLRAPRYGQGRTGGKLIVDGRDETVFRKADFAFKPFNGAQKVRLLGLLDATRETYNAALQSRRDAWRHQSKTRIDLFDQFSDLTGLREDRGDLFAWGLQPLRWSLRRVDEAFSAFFRRVEHGETPGYPRFKSWTRWNTVGYDEVSGWRLVLDGVVPKSSEVEKTSTKSMRHRFSCPTQADLKAKRRHQKAKPHLFVQGVGVIPLSRSAVRQLRRYLARGGAATTLTLTRVNREGTAWRASIGFKNLAVEHVAALSLDSVTGIDRGVAVLVASASGRDREENPGRLIHRTGALAERLDGIWDQIKRTQQQRSTKKQHGRRWRQLSKEIRDLHSKAANITSNWAWHVAGELVAASEVLVLEDLNLAGMTKSAKGTIEEPGKNVAQKTGLNRSLAESAPGKVAKCLSVKAESAGRRVWLVNPAYTSQQCSACGVIDAKSRINRDVYYCWACGHYEHADINAARNIRARGLTAEAAWRAEGSPSLVRPVPRLRRRKKSQPEVAAQTA
jgi:putative transposase